MKTTFQYDHYFDYEELTLVLEHFQKTCPDWIKVKSLAKTPENRNIWAAELSDFTADMPKAGFYIDASHHAGEVTGSMAALHFLDYILTNKEDPMIRNLLKKRVIYILPRISPDGTETYLKTPHLLRSVNRNYPSPDPENGLHPQDLDGDGVIRKMRIVSPSGSWKESPDDPRLMIRRQPDDTEGTFYEIYDEGILLNYAGGDIPVIKDQWGLDFNRNYPFGWFMESRQSGAGPYPLSNPETKAVADFVIAHPNICFALTMHTSGGVLVYPPGTMPESQGEMQDMKMYREIGKMATQEMGYPVVNIFDGFMTDQKFYPSGAFDDWAYHTQGIPTYTVELWDMAARAGVEPNWSKVRTPDQQAEDYRKQLKWIDEHLGSDAVKPWTRISHPQLPDRIVEIGGFDFKFTVQNCPPSFLLQEAEKTTRFILRNLKVLPDLCLSLQGLNKISSHIYKIEVKLQNTGYLPTYICAEAKKANAVQPIHVQCETSGKVLSEAVLKVPSLEGYGTIPSEYSYHGITTHPHDPQSAILAFLIEAKPGDCVMISADHVKTGRQKLQIMIES